MGRVRIAHFTALTSGLLLCLATSGAATGQATPPAPFDAKVAWASFEKILGEGYSYRDRPEIDGSDILAAFAQRAQSARSDKDFIDVLQLVAHNFADPHFIVGPLDQNDWAVIPTSSDMKAIYSGTEFRVLEVRAESDALAKGVRTGMKILTIEGKSPDATVEEIMGRPLASLNAIQIAFGLNIALAGKRLAPRVIEMGDGHRKRVFRLAPSVDQAKRVEDGPKLAVERRGSLGIIRINNSLGDYDLIPEFRTALASLSDTTRLLIDLRNTPSGGNTIVAKGIMGHFVTHDRPYQMHVISYDARVYGPTRKFVEYVAPFPPYYPGKVYVAGGHWTGSMGEGLMIGFDAIGATTIGTDLGDLLGALNNLTITGSSAKIDFATEELFTVTGIPRANYRPQIYLQQAERDMSVDPILSAIER